jgi:hypothetical protein
MKKTVGLWIDHDKAVIVTLAGKNEEEIKLINSNLDKHRGQSGNSKPADDIRLRELTGNLNRYYDEVVEFIQGAGAIQIFGPGEAKGELNKRLEKHNYAGKISGVEPADKMTEPQIVAKVRDHFLGGSMTAEAEWNRLSQ